MTRLVDPRVFGHGQMHGHAVFVRGKYPNRVWRCSRHDCSWVHSEAVTT